MTSDRDPLPIPADAQLSHVGMFVRDLDLMTAFYRSMLGMAITDSGNIHGRDMAFLSRTPLEHHQLVMIMDPQRAHGMSALGQLSFRLPDLEGLRAYFAFLAGQGVEGLEGRNHGNSWSLYFFDPEGNKIELYVPTPWQVRQPWRAPLDLYEPAQAIYARTEQLMRDAPGNMPVEQWQQQFAARLSASQLRAA